MEEQLDRIFKNINDWLKFAEMKNAMIIGLNGVVLFGVLRLAKSDTGFLHERIYIIFAVLVSYSAIVAILSFYPQTKIKWFWLAKNALPEHDDNLLFYSHIKRYDADGYLHRLNEGNRKRVESFSKVEKNYSSQIIINSNIADDKFSYFKHSVGVFLFSVAWIIISSAVWLLFIK